MNRAAHIINWLKRAIGIASPTKVWMAIPDWDRRASTLNEAELIIAVDIMESAGPHGQFWRLAYDGAEVLR